MGTCSSTTMKQTMRVEINQLKQKRSLTSTPNIHTTRSNIARQHYKSKSVVMVTSSKDQQLKNLKNINNFLICKYTNFSSCYSLLQKGNEENQFISIQHNTTGTKRIIKTYKMADSKYVTSLLQYQLHHPNLVQQFEIYEESHMYHIVEENNEKIVMLNPKKMMKEFDIALIFNQMVEVVDYLHHQQLVHGHLTVESFALFGQNYLKLIDLYALFMKKTLSVTESHYFAPEIFSTAEYTQVRDIWSLGIILYVMLYKEFPFQGTTAREIREQTQQSDLQLNDKVSEEANNLLQQLLQRDPEKRIKIKDISNSAWLKKQQVFLKEEQIKDTLLRLSSTKKIDILQAYLLKFIINNYPPDKLREIYSVFRSLDLDQDGYFSISELLRSYKEYVEDNEASEMVCQTIFRKVDLDEDGKITFAEFILYAMDRNKLLEDEILENSFKLLKNKKNFITSHQLALQYSLEKDEFQQLIFLYANKNYVKYSLQSSQLLKIFKQQ